MFPPATDSASPAGSAGPAAASAPGALPRPAPSGSAPSTASNGASSPSSPGATSAASAASPASAAPAASGANAQASSAATAGGAAAAASTAAPSAPREDSGRVPEIDDDKLGWAWPTTGKVVYAGAGLRGYGKLIIIKHNKTYLSAYAHNREILVKEGQTVAKGQQVAEMGDSDADQVKLHFEIRRLGKPIDPTRFLPPA